MPELLLQMSGISKFFSGNKVLEDVQFELRSGETHVLAGENGAGKTTLMRILSGVYTEYEGEICIRGIPVRFSSPRDAARHGVSIIHQELSLIPYLSVAENIYLGREQTGRFGRLCHRREIVSCAALLARVGIDADPRSPAGAYPLGVQQAIEIAKALAFDASILIMDEPTSALTAPEVERLFLIMEDLRREGRGIVYITHKMEEIYRVAQRITVLRDGRLVAVSHASRLSRPELIRQMVGREVGEWFPGEPDIPGAPALEVRRMTLPDPAGRPRPILNGLGFHVRSGEVLGIGGLQGSGASELLNGIFGAYGKAVQGDFTVAGQDYRPVSPRAALRRGIALLVKDRKRGGLVPAMSVTHNVTLAALPRYSPCGWLNEGRERRAAEERQRHFGIRVSDLRQAASTLSGGNQQKVVLAKCLEAGPKVLLLDEPTRGVDVGAKQEIYALMKVWTRSGIAIIFTTSEMPELLALSDRIMVLHHGACTALFSRAEASAESVLAAAMGRAQEDPL